MAGQKKDLKDDFQKLVATLENMILIGALQPRERLVETCLAKRLDTSRSWIRDALKILEAKGLVEVVPYRGAMVRELTEEEVQETFDIRVVLENLCHRLACKHFKKSDAEFLRNLAARIKDCYHRQNFEDMISANNEFHRYIRELAGNKTLLLMLDQLRGRFYLFNTYAWSSPGMAENLVEEHDKFVEALEKKDLQLLYEVAERHISYSRDLYLLQLKTRKAMADTAGET